MENYDQGKAESSGRKIIFIIIAIAALGFLLIGGYYIYTKNNNNVPVAVFSPLPESAIDSALDSDSDTIPDAVEKAIRTNPNKMDTDGDSYNDLPEIKSGYSPLIAGTAGKYTSEQLQALKDKIKAANAGFYEREFGTGSKTAPGNEDFSSPEAAYRVYISALEAKNVELYIKTLDKGSVEAFNTVFSGSFDGKTIDSFNNIQADIWKKADYKILEQTDKYAIMAPVSREQQVSAPKGASPASFTAMPNMYFRKEDNLWKIDFVAVMSELGARKFMGVVAKNTDINSPENEKILKQIIDDWKASFK